MNNLYVFAIGGSGERVMRSLIMLLASGVKLNANSVTPVFVDNDNNSAALTRCENLIKFYNNSLNSGRPGIGTLCQELPAGQRPSFFETKINEPVLLNIAGNTIGNLEQIIGSLSKDNAIEKLILEERNLLFSQDDLEMPLTVGFVGNPNIGSVVLNSLSFRDPAFQTILQNASTGDGVIVVGSLFGGTGAAGFPLMVNSFMSNDKNRPTVGGVAVLPYFDFESKDAHAPNEAIINTQKYDVNSDSFSTKTRAALMYYDDYMSRQMDYLYYVGDDSRAHYEHYVGGAKQDNPVHVVELLGAMSVIDFAQGSNQAQIVYKEPVWGLKSDKAGNPGVANVSSVIMPEVRKALVKFQLLREFFFNEGDGFLKHDISNNKAYVTDLGIKEEMRTAVVGKKCTTPINDIKTLNNTVVSEVLNYDPAWGLNAFFKEWDAWFANLYDPRGRRVFQIYPYNDASVDHQNVTQKFYNNGNHGVARVETKSKGIFKKEYFQVAVNPTIADYIVAAHSASPIKSPETKLQLPALLRLVSNALDAVLAQKCDI